MPDTRSNATFEFLSLSNVKPKRKLHHDDSIRLAKRQKRCPLRKKKENGDIMEMLNRSLVKTTFSILWFPRGYDKIK